MPQPEPSRLTNQKVPHTQGRLFADCEPEPKPDAAQTAPDPQQPTLDQWQSLLEAAVEFRDLAPWAWMFDTQLFGVRDPASGQTGWCCVLGAIGEVMGLAVYRGDSGLWNYLRIAHGRIPRHELHGAQDCVMVSFESSKGVRKEDRSVIKELGLGFRGRNQWPCFDSYLPGYGPWRIDRQDALLLTTSLRQAVEMAQRFKRGPSILPRLPDCPPEDEDRVLVRVPDEKASSGWRDEIVPPMPRIPARDVQLGVDLDRLARLSAGARRSQSLELELSCFPLPAEVGPRGQRCPYPIAMLIVEPRQGVILGNKIMHPPFDPTIVQEEVVTFLERMNVLPSSILVDSETAFDTLLPVVQALDVEVVHIEELDVMSEVRDGLFASMMR